MLVSACEYMEMPVSAYTVASKCLCVDTDACECV